MLLSHIKRLCTLLPTLISTHPLASPISSDSPVPTALQRAVPACAQSCLRTSLSERFPLGCTSQQSLSCLCSRYSSSGESLGEVALGCIYAACANVDSSAASAYNICLGQQNAVMPTQTALTVTASTMPRSTPTTTSVSISSAKSTVVTSSSTQISGTPSGAAEVASATVFQSSPFPTPTPSETATAVPSAPRTMSPAQIAGLSIAAAATFVMAIGLMVLSVFLRRRRERRRASKGTIMEKPTRSTPKQRSRRFTQRFSIKPLASTKYSKADSRPPVPGKQKRIGVGLAPVPRPKLERSAFNYDNYQPRPLYEVPLQSNLNQRHTVESPLTIPAFPQPASGPSELPNDPIRPENIGLAISGELPSYPFPAVPPRAPERIISTQQRPKSIARRIGGSNERPDSVLTQETVFEEDTPLESRRTSKLLPTPPIPVPPLRIYQAYKPQNSSRIIPQQKRTPLNRPQAAHQPELSLSIPARHSRSHPKRVAPQEMSSHSRSISQEPLLQPMPDYEPARSTSIGKASPDSSNGGYIPDYYFTAYNTVQETPPVPPMASQSQGRSERTKSPAKVANITPKPSSSNVSQATSRRTASVRDSISSQTSFEDNDGYDSTPEEDEDKQLSDSKLSPVAESPISNLRYPKVPRASNQLVPRSPRSPRGHQRTGSDPRRVAEPSSLLVKRRGEQQAQQLEEKLRIGTTRQHSADNSTDSSRRLQDIVADSRSRTHLSPQSAHTHMADVTHPIDAWPRPTEEALPSPAWVPRLTPTRQGDDLFISVTYR